VQKGDGLKEALAFDKENISKGKVLLKLN